MTDNGVMPTLLGIGDFSRMTHLSIKALRHYHDVALLVPARVDRATGYRYYEADQVVTAQVIRRFRDLGMPVDEVRDILAAADVATRNEVIVAHLERMQQQLEQTRATVGSLRSLLDPSSAGLPVEYRSVPATPALAVAETVLVEEGEEWWFGAFDELYRTAAAVGAEVAGPAGALYPGEFFELEKGDLVAFLPLAAPASAGSDRARPFVVPPAELAVALHKGPFADIDTTYGALGLHVTQRAIGVEGPVREHYLVTFRHTPDQERHRTEVCWPVFRTAVPATSDAPR